MDQSQEETRRRPTAEHQQAEGADAFRALAGAIAHDLNNLLMGISGNVSLLLLDKPSDHRDLTCLKNIEKTVERASALTRQILAMARGARDGGAGADGPMPAAPDGAAQPYVPGQTERPAPKGILLVEDEEIVATIGEKMLTRLGYRVWVAHSGIEAIKLFVQHHSEIELAILDMVMPGMTGGEVFDRLRSVNPEVAVLLSSGYGLDSQAAALLERGCRGFIQKPFGIEQLKEKISRVLEDR